MAVHRPLNRVRAARAEQRRKLAAGFGQSSRTGYQLLDAARVDSVLAECAIAQRPSGEGVARELVHGGPDDSRPVRAMSGTASTRSEFAAHRLADLVPPMSDDDYRALAESIRQDGLEHPITLYEGAVLDGRHRQRACLEVGVEPRFKEYAGDDPIRFVMRQETRRHQTVSQRAMMAQAFLPELERQARERQAHGLTAPGQRSVSMETERSVGAVRATAEAGRIVGVSRATVGRARRVACEDPDLAERVKAGELTVRAAERTVRERAPWLDCVT